MHYRFPDAYIDRWADYYLTHPAIRRRGVLFIAFLQSPESIAAVIRG